MNYINRTSFRQLTICMFCSMALVVMNFGDVFTGLVWIHFYPFPFLMFYMLVFLHRKKIRKRLFHSNFLLAACWLAWCYLPVWVLRAWWSDITGDSYRPTRVSFSSYSYFAPHQWCKLSCSDSWCCRYFLILLKKKKTKYCISAFDSLGF